MNTNLKMNRSNVVSQAAITHCSSGVSRRIGTLYAMTLSNRRSNTDRIFGISRTIQQSIAETFGQTKYDGTAHRALPETDQKSYELTADVLRVSSATARPLARATRDELVALSTSGYAAN